MMFLIGVGVSYAGADDNHWVQRAYAALADLDTLPIPTEPVFAEGVEQPVFGFLIDQLDDGYVGVITSDHLKAVIEAHPKKSRFSHTIFSELRRAPQPKSERAFSLIVMPGPSQVSVPYSFLGYHPGTIEVSENVLMEEWHLGEYKLRDAWNVDQNTYELSDVTLWGILDGILFLDVDGWLDKMLGGKLDDTRLVGGVLFTYEGVRYALAMGYNDNGQGQYGALDLKRDRAHVSSPNALKVVSRNMRVIVISNLRNRGIQPWWDELRKDNP